MKFRWGIFGSVLLAGCQTLQPVSTQDRPYEFVRGTVTYQGGVYFLKPCFSQNLRQIKDVQGLVAERYREQSPLSRLPIYMELWAYQDTQLQWHVDSVNLAGGSSQACQVSLNNIQYRAAGQNPPWRADVTDSTVRVEILNELRNYQFPNGNTSSTSRRWTEQITTGNRTHDLSMQFFQRSCYDELGAWYPLEAVVNLDGRRLTGCVREGDVMNRSLPGRYSNGLNPGEAFLVLDVMSDGTSRLSVDYRNGTALNVFTGTWRWTRTEKLALEFTELNGRNQQTILLLKHRLGGGWVPDGFNDLLGSAQVELLRSE